MDGRGPTICLCMIVKDEALVIRRCLDSVRSLIDHWVIVDTGSSDATRDLILAHFRDVPGTLYERPWRDFAHNRSEALTLARPHGAYSLIIDADDTLDVPEGYRVPPLTADSYVLDIEDSSIRYQRTQLVRNALPWCYRGVLHEFLSCEGAGAVDSLPIVMRRGHDGARRREPETYWRDAAILEAALATEADPFLVARYTFYLAQSYRDCGEMAKALAAYERRAEMGFWEQEVFVSLLAAARLKEGLGHDLDEVIAAFEHASEAEPGRAEGLHGASRLCRTSGRYEEGYRIAARGLDLTAPSDGLFVERWVHEYGLLDEYAINAYWAGHYHDSLKACLRILEQPGCPESERGRFAANCRFAAERLAGAPDVGSFGQDDFAAQHGVTAARALRSGLTAAPRVLIAVLAKQKEPSLALYLACIEALDYPKTSIVLYIRTNNNTDGTERILREWIALKGDLYAGIEFDAEDVAARVEQFGVHEWNPTRFSVLGKIRNISLRRTIERDCAFYFVCDVDNFIRPETLRELVALNLPIVAPLLRAIDPGGYYANFHAEVDANGYYKECDQYRWILHRWVRGIFEMPVVHCTYLIRADVLGDLTYEDGSSRYEYVVFSDSARKASVPQYLDNRQVYGYITFDEGDGHHVAGGIEKAGLLLDDGNARTAAAGAMRESFDRALAAHDDLKIGAPDRDRPPGPLAINQSNYVSFVERFVRDNQVRSVVELGDDDWRLSNAMYWAGITPVRLSVASDRTGWISADSGRSGTTQFLTLDAVPDGDLLLCQDISLLCHDQTFEESIGILKQKFRFILITGDSGRLVSGSGAPPEDIIDPSTICLSWMIRDDRSRAVYKSTYLIEGLDDRIEPACQGRGAAGSRRVDIPPIHLINLDRGVERLARFKQLNRHLKDVIRFPAADGAKLNRLDLIKDGYIAEDLSYLAGTTGCALSHIKLWEKAASSNQSLTIFEDDIAVSHQFEKRAREVLSVLPDDWDIIQWGYILNPLFIWLDFGVSKAKLEHFGGLNFRGPSGPVNFQAVDNPVVPVKLLHSFGLMGYSISAKGARAALDFCLPLHNRMIRFPEPGIVTQDSGIDITLCGLYPSIKAYACVPQILVHFGETSNRQDIDAEETAGALAQSRDEAKGV